MLLTVSEVLDRLFTVNEAPAKVVAKSSTSCRFLMTASPVFLINKEYVSEYDPSLLLTGPESTRLDKATEGVAVSVTGVGSLSLAGFPSLLGSGRLPLSEISVVGVCPGPSAVAVTKLLNGPVETGTTIISSSMVSTSFTDMTSFPVSKLISVIPLKLLLILKSSLKSSAEVTMVLPKVVARLSVT